MPGPYFANCGPLDGPMRQSDGRSAFGVALEMGGVSDHGAAWACAPVPDPRGPVATYRITVGPAELPGRWVCVGRRFVPLDEWLGPVVIRVISGGQADADYGALLAAEVMGVPTTGAAPRGFLTEDGPRPELGTRFGLVAIDGGYAERTRLNVEDGDGTLIYARQQDLDDHASGTALTLRQCERRMKPHYVALAEDPASLDPAAAVAWIRANTVRRLNVAGPRASKAPRIEGFVRGHLAEVLGMLKESEGGL